MADILELHEFFVEGNNQEKSHVLLHITEPSTAEERKKGYFFALAEINNGSIEQIEKLQKMIDELEISYYETPEEGEKNAFEIILENINRRGHQILQYRNSETNCLVGVMRNHEVSFAYHGNPQAVLFYRNKENELEQINIIEEQEPETKNEQLFSAIIQGTVNVSDFFYVISPHVAEYFSHDRVKKILSTRNTRQSAEHIQKVLNDLNSEFSFGGIFMHYPSDIPRSGRYIPIQEKGSDASINELLARERNTEEIMSPPLLRGLKKKINDYKQNHRQNQLLRDQEERKEKILNKTKGVIETNFRPREEGEEGTVVNSVLVTLGRALFVGISGFLRLLKNIIINLSRGTVALILLITNKDNKRQDVIKHMRTYCDRQKENFSELPLLSKLLFFSAIILAIIFIASVTVFKVKENLDAQEQAYNNQVQLIVDKKNTAEASIIYGDETRALSLLLEAKTALGNLPAGSKSQKEKITELSSSIDSVLQKLRKTATVAPEMIIDLNTAENNIPLTHLAQLDNTLFAYGDTGKSLYKINLADKSKEVKEYSISHLFNASTPKEQDMIIFISGPMSIAEYNKESALVSSKDITFPTNNTNLADIFVYSRKLYSLDPATNQIYKHSQTQTGYDKGTSWVKDETIDLKDAVSLAIDGDLFALKKNGEIIKMANGQKQPFAITGLDPALDKPTKIWTYNGLQNIYILEATNKRVVILNKEGKLINQYTADNWQNPTSLIVDEAGKKIYVLDSNKIYQVKI